jgi:hypothetical protein
MTDFNPKDGQKMFVEAFRLPRAALSDEALRARLQDCQTAGLKIATGAVERELAFRQRKDLQHVETSSS